MIRALLAATAITSAAVAAAPLASAEPGPIYDDDPGRYATDVPGMSYDARLAGPCTNFDRFTFGRGRGGEALQCRYIRDQSIFPEKTGFWVAVPQLYGVQEVGSPCPKPEATAQAPNGDPLSCLGEQGWQPGFVVRREFLPPPAQRLPVAP